MLHTAALYQPSPSSTGRADMGTQTTTPNMTTANFVHIDTNSYTEKPWAKVDGPGQNFERKSHSRPVHNLRGREHEFNTDNAGFAVYNYPAKEKRFTTMPRYGATTTRKSRPCCATGSQASKRSTSSTTPSAEE